jgi:hypothetical protein
MRPPQVNYGWNPIESAPLDEDIALGQMMADGKGGRASVGKHKRFSENPLPTLADAGIDKSLAPPSRRLALDDIPPPPATLARRQDFRAAQLRETLREVGL